MRDMTAPQSRVIRKPEVQGRTGLSGRTIDRLEAAGQFPSRRQLSARAVGWIEEEVTAWVAARRRAEHGDHS